MRKNLGEDHHPKDEILEQRLAKHEEYVKEELKNCKTKKFRGHLGIYHTYTRDGGKVRQWR